MERLKEVFTCINISIISRSSLGHADAKEIGTKVVLTGIYNSKFKKCTFSLKPAGKQFVFKQLHELTTGFEYFVKFGNSFPF